jgi:cell division septal protein FtsQ
MKRRKYHLKRISKRRLTIKERKKLAQRFFTFSIFFLIVLSFFYVIFGPYFQIKEVEIKGVFRFNSKENLEKEIKDLITFKFLFLETRNILLIRQKSLEKQIKNQDFLVRDLSLEKKYPDKIIVTLTERSPLGILKTQDGNFLFDERGLFF